MPACLGYAWDGVEGAEVCVLRQRLPIFEQPCSSLHYTQLLSQLAQIAGRAARNPWVLCDISQRCGTRSTVAWVRYGLQRCVNGSLGEANSFAKLCLKHHGQFTAPSSYVLNW